jgi:long-chain acyl-CoA synthetase
MSAAAPLPLQIERRWRERFGKILYQGYGLTESSPFASYNHHAAYREGTVGTPIDGVQMRVVDVDTGRPLPPGERGEIVIRGPNVMLGYWRKPEETGQAIQDGWLHTGDVGCVDNDGYIRVDDRLKDMVIVGGFNVYPVEVENVLFRHPAVAEAAVYGVPDPIMGERLRAAVLLRSGESASAEDLLAFCKPFLAEYKLPVEFEFVSELPKGRTGKVLKRVLRDRFRANGNGHRTEVVGTAAELENRIVNWLAERLPPGIRPDPEKTLADSGFTSLLALELAERMSHWVGREVRPTITWSYPTPASLARNLMGGGTASRTVEGGIASEIARLSDAEVEASLAAELHKLARAQTAGEA